MRAQSQPAHTYCWRNGTNCTDTDMVLMALSHYFDAKTLLISPIIGTYNDSNVGAGLVVMETCRSPSASTKYSVPVEFPERCQCPTLQRN